MASSTPNQSKLCVARLSAPIALVVVLLAAKAVAAQGVADCAPPPKEKAPTPDDARWRTILKLFPEFERLFPLWKAEVPNLIKRLDDVDHDMQAQALHELFEGLSVYPSDPVTRYVARYLTARKLRYDSSDARSDALYWFKRLLRDKPRELIPIVRDGLNDPDSRVRMQAVGSLFDTLDNAAREKWLDVVEEIFDLLITKGLCDDNEEVSDGACVGLGATIAAPTPITLRSLQRAMASRHIHPTATEFVKKTIEPDWKTKVYGLAKPKPPKGDQGNPFEAHPARKAKRPGRQKVTATTSGEDAKGR